MPKVRRFDIDSVEQEVKMQNLNVGNFRELLLTQLWGQAIRW